MPRKLFTWKLRSRELRLGERTLIVGILNVTPDSFSDGGQYDSPELALARAIEIEAQGADILDIGAESTKPGSTRISAAEELRRLIPVLKRLKGELQIPISVDTYKAEVASIALEHGAEIINDPSGFTFDPLLAKVVVESNAGLILNHMRGTPETWAKLPPMPDIMGAVVKDLDASANRARRAGMDKLRMVLDPGLGFGKRKEQNAEILSRLGELAKLEYPMMTGPSRKSFLAQGTEEETLYATASAVAASILNGASMVRVHDVAAMRAVANVADEIARSERLEEEEPAKRPVGRRTTTPEVAATERPLPTRPPLVRKPPPPPREEEALERSPERPPMRRPPPPDRGGERGGDRPFAPRRSSGPPSRPPSDRGDRPFTPRRSSGPPSDRPSDRGDRPYPPRRSGPPSDRGDRSSGPPRRSGPPSDRGDRPPFRGDRPSGPPRGDRPYGPPRGDRPSGPPRGDRPFGPKRSGSSGAPSRFGAAKKFGSGPRKFGPRKDGPPRKDYPPRGPKRDK